MRLLFVIVALAFAVSQHCAAADATAAATPRPAAAAANVGLGHRLAREASPYLRQHAENPVEWYPWGEEAFARARRENKPIFLSVGYSTCYWCHVMKRESFEDGAIADLLNRHFVSIKVDRERRPDVDATYMIATELIARSGGWPNSVFLTPDLQPFYALTYAPPGEFKDLAGRIAETWTTEEKALRADGERVAGLIEKFTNRAAQPLEIGEKTLARASLAILSEFDPFNGGIGTAPKFPREPVLGFLLRRALADRDPLAREALEITLDNILAGGIHDHIAGGFHRYAVDNAWAVPHFEKMLYTQAQLGDLLVGTHQLTGNAKYASAARATFDYVLRELTTQEGGFASAFDAETDGVEGLYYLWSKSDFEAAAAEDATFGRAVFPITEDGNHEGRNTLRLETPLGETARAMGLAKSEFAERYARLLSRLEAARKSRPPLKRDDKVVASWNALTIAALARASSVLEEPRYLTAATRAMDLLRDRLGACGDGMHRTYFEGGSDLAANSADYAAVGLAAIALFEAESAEAWRLLARDCARVLLEKFLDETTGEVFLTREKTGFVRAKQYDDGDIPGANALALELFTRLARLDADPDWRHAADRLAGALSGLAPRTPVAMSASLAALDRHARGTVSSWQSLGKGAVIAKAKVAADGHSAVVTLDIASGWHVNSDRPDEQFLVPTRLSLTGVPAAIVTYPDAVERTLSVHDKPLRLFEGRGEIEVKPDDAGARFLAAQQAELTLQACSDRICLEPETVKLLFSAPIDE